MALTSAFSFVTMMIYSQCVRLGSASEPAGCMRASVLPSSGPTVCLPLDQYLQLQPDDSKSNVSASSFIYYNKIECVIYSPTSKLPQRRDESLKGALLPRRCTVTCHPCGSGKTPIFRRHRLPCRNKRLNSGPDHRITIGCLK